MSDKSSQVAETPATAFQIPATPTPAQVAAGIRQLIGYAGMIAAGFGYNGWSVHLNGLLVDPGAMQGLGIAATLIVFVWGQINTRLTAKKLTVIAAAAPDPVAVVKS